MRRRCLGGRRRGVGATRVSKGWCCRGTPSLVSDGPLTSMTALWTPSPSSAAPTVSQSLLFWLLILFDYWVLIQMSLGQSDFYLGMKNYSFPCLDRSIMFSYWVLAQMFCQSVFGCVILEWSRIVSLVSIVLSCLTTGFGSHDLSICFLFCDLGKKYTVSVVLMKCWSYCFRSYAQICAESDGIKRVDVVPFEESFAGTYSSYICNFLAPFALFLTLISEHNCRSTD